MDAIRIPIPSVGFHPPVYPCRRAELPFIPDGRLDKPFWEKAEFTCDFADIEGKHIPSHDLLPGQNCCGMTKTCT